MVSFENCEDIAKGPFFKRTMVSSVPVSRVLPSSQSHQPLTNTVGLRKYFRSNDVRKKVSSECSIAYQLNQDYSRLATALRPKRPRWVKGY
ncbi:hypothetical protein MTR_2g461610 [Medicago truncatula]|uniref:Uncharacterized protein n=1 Tax=Medicago truncatula TaxID=3880 RepID=A0A072V7T2_MEDTR|nr:hypothetical protein MTR_2g461610 [Medicago truncatula]